MIKYLRAFKTQEEYLAYSASTAFTLDNVSSCREGDLVYYTSENCGGYIPPTPATGKSIANAVVTCDSATYNGSVQTAQNIVVTLSGNTLIVDTDYTITENTGGTNAGNYVVKVDGIGHYSGTTTGTFVINKANIIPYVTIAGWTYGNTASEPIVTGNLGNGTVTYYYKLQSSSSWSVTKPSNAGEYDIQADIATTTNYNSGTCSNTFTINKGNGKVTTSPTAKSMTYNGNAQALVIAGSGTGTMLYKLGSGSWSTDIPSGTTAGTYTVYYKASANTNYNESASYSVNSNIAKANPTYTAPTAKSLTYNGSAQELLNPGSVTGGTIQYSSDNSTWSSTRIPSGTTAGTYTSYWRIVGDTNYNDKSSTSIRTTIAKADTIYTAPTAKSLTYNGSAQELLNPGSVTGGTMQYCYYNSSRDSDWSTTIIPSGTNAGDYVSYWRIVGDTNYKDKTSTSITTTIAKADPIYTAPTAKSLTYNGSAQELLNPGSVTGGTIQYSSDNSTWSSTRIPSGTNAGDYTSYWKIVGDTNHKGKNSTSINTTIDKVTPTVVAPTAKVLIYNAQAQELVNAGSTDYGTLKYAIAGEVPYDSEVEYLKSDGYQYIDLPIIPNSSTGIYIKVKPIMYNYASADDHFIVGLRNNSSNTRWCIGKNGTGKYGCSMYYGYGGYSYFSNSHISYDTIFEVSLNYLNSKQAVNNGSTKSLSTLLFTPSYPIRLFGSSGVNGSYSKAAAYLYSCKVSQGTEIIMDLIPVRKDGVGYMFDKISGTLYGNNGTSSFVIGNDVNNNNVSEIYRTSIPSGTDAGDYTVYYRVDGDSNVNDVAAQSVACSINKKQVTATIELNPSAYTYNGSACEPAVTAKDGSTVIPASEYTVTYSNNVNTGTATVTISDKVGGNYEVNGSSTTFTINKASGSVTTPPTANNLIYNGTSQTLTTSGSGTGTMLYKLGNDSWSTDIPSGTTAGTYTVYYKASASTNYEESTSGSVNCAIAKADSSLSFAVTDLYIGIGSTKSNPVTVNAGDGTVTYSSNNTSIVTVDNSGVVSGVGSGNTTVSANISSTSNYNSATTSYNISSFTWGITAKYNVTDTSGSTRIIKYANNISKIEIDGVEMSLRTGYTFSTTGEHTVRFMLTDPTTIIDNAFNECYNLTSIELPDSITSIGGGAFYYCTSLTSINIPSGVTSIGSTAFESCSSLTSIDIPSGITSIGYWTFADCDSLTRLNSDTDGIFNIPDGVTSIGEHAFLRCSGLTSVNIPSGITSINEGTFQECSSLTSIVIPDTVTSIGNGTFEYCTALTSITIPDSVTSIGKWAFYDCTSLTSVDIPSGVTSVDSYAFEWCTGLTSITVNAVTPPTLGTYVAFDTTHNYPIYVPCDSVDTYKAATNWNTYASRIEAIPGTCPPYVESVINVTDTSNPTKIVRSTSNLTKIEVDGIEQSSLTTGYTFDTTGEHTVKYELYDQTTLGTGIFRECTGLTSCIINCNIENVSEYTFYGCNSLTSVTIPNSVTSIGGSAFNECTSLTRLNSSIDGVFNIPSGVTNISTSAFQYCHGLTSVTIPDSVTSIGQSAFEATHLVSVNIPSGVTMISSYVFNGCTRLTSVTIPNSVTSIGSTVFNECDSLISINIPSGVTSIGDWAFTNCSVLTSVTVEATTPPTLGTGAFSVTNDCPIYVPCDSVDAYKAATNWSTYASRIQAIPGSCPPVLTGIFNVTDTSNPTSIANSTAGFSKIEIDDVEQQSVTTDYTFSTTGNHTVKYTLTGASIDNHAFTNCYGLTNMAIPDGVTSIGISSFYNCSGLTSCTIGSGVTYIGANAFSGCTSLTSVTIPDSVETIGQRVFSNCSGLTSINIPSGVTSISQYAFSRCSSLTSIDIPDSVTSIGTSAFDNCSGLTSCTMGSGVTTIGQNAFYGCSSLTSIVIPDSVTSIGTSAFVSCTSLTSVTIPSGVTSINNGAFADCTSLTSIVIPDSVTSIGTSAFGSCTSLTSCTIGSGVTSIGSGAFQRCTGLTSITSNAVTAPTIKSNTFQQIKTGGTLTVPIGSSGYDVWMGTGDYYLGMYNWTKVEQ